MIPLDQSGQHCPERRSVGLVPNPPALKAVGVFGAPETLCVAGLTLVPRRPSSDKALASRRACAAGEMSARPGRLADSPAQPRQLLGALPPPPRPRALASGLVEIRPALPQHRPVCSNLATRSAEITPIWLRGATLG